MTVRKLIAPIAISLSAVALSIGSTFALFTSKAETNIAVTSGKVEVTATISDVHTFSGQWNEETSEYDIVATEVEGTFTNGGTASLSGDTLTLSKISPMDKVTFNITVTNLSNITIKMRTVAKCTSDDGLFDGLSILMDGEEFSGDVTSNWEAVEPGSEPVVIPMEVYLPNTGNDDVDNTYQNKSCSIKYTVEAVQGNAHTEDPAPVSTKKIYDFSVAEVAAREGMVDGGLYGGINASWVDQFINLDEDEMFKMHLGAFDPSCGFVYNEAGGFFEIIGDSCNFTIRFDNLDILPGYALSLVKFTFVDEIRFTDVYTYRCPDEDKTTFIPAYNTCVSFLSPTDPMTKFDLTTISHIKFTDIHMEFSKVINYKINLCPTVFGGGGPLPGYEDGDPISGFDDATTGISISFANPDVATHRIKNGFGGDYGRVEVVDGQSLIFDIPDDFKLVGVGFCDSCEYTRLDNCVDVPEDAPWIITDGYNGYIDVFYENVSINELSLQFTGTMCGNLIQVIGFGL